MGYPRILTKENSETIMACLTLTVKILYSEKPIIESDDERVSRERVYETIEALMPEGY